MGITCFPILGSTTRPKHDRSVLRVVKMDGKVLEFRTPILVKDVPLTGIATTRSSKETLEPDFKLRLGKTYYIVPCSTNLAAPMSHEQGGEVKRIKVVITKQQLQDLLSDRISMEDVISQLQKRKSIESPRSWKPRLDSILE